MIAHSPEPVREFRLPRSGKPPLGKEGGKTVAGDPLSDYVHRVIAYARELTTLHDTDALLERYDVTDANEARARLIGEAQLVLWELADIAERLVRDDDSEEERGVAAVKEAGRRAWDIHHGTGGEGKGNE